MDKIPPVPYNGLGGIFMEFRPIAHIRSDFSEKFGIPRQSGLVEELTADVVF